MQLNIDPRLEGETAHLFIVAGIIQPDNTVKYFQKNGAQFVPWDPNNFEALLPAESYVFLSNLTKYTVFQGSLNGLNGKIQLYYGYLLNGQKKQELIYNKNRSMQFTVY